MTVAELILLLQTQDQGAQAVLQEDCGLGLFKTSVLVPAKLRKYERSGYVWFEYWDEPVAHEDDLSLTGVATNVFAESVAAVILK